jgi:predicted nucleic acid-binding protein
MIFVDTSYWAALGNSGDRWHDAASFALLHRKKVRDVYAFDEDFSTAGFVQVRP